eukprot:CCRYP_016108-RA/>CCRYP_016108-RA protein AED:0.12 eAED:1.00 QI:0/-1/0/1/-1/0/1/0/98
MEKLPTISYPPRKLEEVSLLLDRSRGLIVIILVLLHSVKSVATRNKDLLMCKVPFQHLEREALQDLNMPVSYPHYGGLFSVYIYRNLSRLSVQHFLMI